MEEKNCRVEKAVELAEALWEKMSPHQRDVCKEIGERAIVSLPMGFGKTLIGLYLAMRSVSIYGEPALAVCSVSLLGTWKGEAKKFCPALSEYITVLHHSSCSMDRVGVPEDTLLVLSGDRGPGWSYDKLNIEQLFVAQEGSTKTYASVNKPFAANIVRSAAILHSKKWSSLIVDEAQRYSNISVKLSRSIASLSAHTRYLMSGTIIQEPKKERHLGIFMLLDAPGIPRSLALFQYALMRGEVPPMRNFCVRREKNPDFDDKGLSFAVNKIEMTANESEFYAVLRGEVADRYNKLLIAEMEQDGHEVKMLNGEILALITYMRMAVISPSLCICQCAKNALYHTSDTATSLLKAISDFINTPGRLEIGSTRLRGALELARNFKGKTVIFSYFSASLKMLKAMMLEEKVDKPIWLLTGSTSVETRNQVCEKLEHSKEEDILMLSYQIGACGLNLQAAKNIIFIDEPWCDGEVQQALKRVHRRGQLSSVTAVELVSNTYIESKILEKHKAKNEAIEEIMNGTHGSASIPKLSIREIAKLLSEEDTQQTILRTEKMRV